MKFFLTAQDELLELAYYSELRGLLDWAAVLLDCAVASSLLFFENVLYEAPAWMTRTVYKIGKAFGLVEVNMEEWLDLLVEWV